MKFYIEVQQVSETLSTCTISWRLKLEVESWIFPFPVADFLKVKYNSWTLYLWQAPFIFVSSLVQFVDDILDRFSFCCFLRCGNQKDEYKYFFSELAKPWFLNGIWSIQAINHSSSSLPSKTLSSTWRRGQKLEKIKGNKNFSPTRRRVKTGQNDGVVMWLVKLAAHRFVDTLVT